MSTSSDDNVANVVSRGIVTRVNKAAVSVAFDEKEELFSLDDDGRFKLTKLANDVTYKRLKR